MYDALIWYAPLVSVCVFTVRRLTSTSFSRRSVKPILRRPANCDTGSWLRNSRPSLPEDTPWRLWSLGRVGTFNTINMLTGNNNGWLDNIGVLYCYFAKCRPTMHRKMFWLRLCPRFFSCWQVTAAFSNQNFQFCLISRCRGNSDTFCTLH
jgi:hypothetical protein